MVHYFDDFHWGNAKMRAIKKSRLRRNFGYFLRRKKTYFFFLAAFFLGAAFFFGAAFLAAFFLVAILFRI